MSDLFENVNKQKLLSHIKNLVSLILADGKVTKSELKVLSVIAVNAGISESEITRIFSTPESISFIPPETRKEKIEQLYDMVLVMMADGEIHDDEIALCRSTAKLLGIENKILDEIISILITCIQQGANLNNVIERIEQLCLKSSR